MMTKFETYLEKLKIEYVAKHTALINKKNNKEWPNEYDHYKVNIKFNNNEIETDFYMGLGNRNLNVGVKKQYSNGGEKYWSRLNGGWAKSAVEAAEKNMTFPLRQPKLADVMNCLLLDAQMSEFTHADWCAELGYDTDSRRGLEIYLKCQEHRVQMLRMFPNKVFEKLVELSGEY